jgi:hypothetical protein
VSTYKGKFTPRFPEKYKGDAHNIIYRSSWEMTFMRHLDANPNVVEWASEEFHIRYLSPVDRQYHRYFPDMWVKYRKPDGTFETYLVEIKPKAQTLLPESKGKTNMRRVKRDLITWGINQAKWEAARRFCADRMWKFRIVTEDDLFPHRRKKI